jgi:hypothetical protein
MFCLKGTFTGQKESFKTILGTILFYICCYFSWILWPDPDAIYQGKLVERLFQFPRQFLSKRIV